MRILLLTQYYAPEQVGAAIWIRQLATDLVSRGHAVTVLTAFPNYPDGRVAERYRGRWFQTEWIEGVRVVRSYIYATAKRGFWPRAWSFGSFCASALGRGLTLRGGFEAVYAILPPLALGVTAAGIARVKGARLVTNVQDLYPYIAVATGYLRNRTAIRFFEAMERWIYRRSERIVVISEGFREHLLGKGVAGDRITVVENWADPDQIRPGERDNAFRRAAGGAGRFLVLYAGGLGHNAAVAPLLAAAELVRDEPFQFVIVGEGVQKSALEEQARNRGLANVVFLPFQPLERYAETLAAADLTVVTLATEATFASVPSKVYKQMAAARPILAITAGANELERLVRAAGCGFCVSPSRPAEIAAALRYAAAHPEELETMGRRARQHLEQHCARGPAVGRIEQALQPAPPLEPLPPLYRLKMALEWILALAALVVLSPVLAALAWWVKLDSPGPVLFRQLRLGRGGRVFPLYKFRTLRWAPGQAPRLQADGSTVVEEADERLTRAGRWLRGGLDELPQLWNVLRGEMTLIGPRPDEPFHAAYYTAEERRKLAVPPGITGLPQVLGRTDIPWKERIRMDLDYIDRHTLRRDLWIATRTVWMALRPAAVRRHAS